MVHLQISASDTAIRKMIKEKPMATVLKPCALLSRICHFRQLKHSLPRGKVPMMLLRCRLWEWFPRTTFTQCSVASVRTCPSTIKAATLPVLISAYSKIDVSLPVRCFSRWRICMPISICTIKPRPHLEGLYRTDTKDYPEDAERNIDGFSVHRDYSFCQHPCQYL